MKALIIVDFQNIWFDKNSEYYVGERHKEIGNTNNLIDSCRNKGYKIIFIKHEDEDFTGEGAEIFSLLNKQSSDVVITKKEVSPFYKTNLEEELKDIKDIVVCGILTNLCVRSCVSDAYDRDFNITLVEDCCIAEEETHKFTIKDLIETRPEIKIVKVEELE